MPIEGRFGIGCACLADCHASAAHAEDAGGAGMNVVPGEIGILVVAVTGVLGGEHGADASDGITGNAVNLGNAAKGRKVSFGTRW